MHSYMDGLLHTVINSRLGVDDPNQQGIQRLPVLSSPRPSDNSTNDLPMMTKKKDHKKKLLNEGKLINSPLYKTLNKSSSENGLSVKKALKQLNSIADFKNIGKKNNKNCSHRSEHSCERRMCNACWAEPTKKTGIDHGLRNLASHLKNSMELQVCFISWLYTSIERNINILGCNELVF